MFLAFFYYVSFSLVYVIPGEAKRRPGIFSQMLEIPACFRRNAFGSGNDSL